METTKVKLSFEVNTEYNKGMPVIIVAAGMSTRMNGINKQAAEICGVPVLARTLMNFERSDVISSIILVVKEGEIFSAQLLGSKYGITKLTDIVCGGDCRQNSVLNGLKRVGEDEKYVLIHDGARPLTEDSVINEVANSLKLHSAVTCAVPVKDTLKQVDKDGTVINTPDRSSFVAVQTPQGVDVSVYRKAIETVGDLSKFTDDMSIMEAAGVSVATVMGSYRNIKITTPEDLKLAEFYICGEEDI